MYVHNLRTNMSQYFNTLSPASLKTLPGKPNGTKPWLREKECRTYLLLPLIQQCKAYLLLPLMQTFIFKTTKSNLVEKCFLCNDNVCEVLILMNSLNVYIIISSTIMGEKSHALFYLLWCIFLSIEQYMQCCLHIWLLVPSVLHLQVMEYLLDSVSMHSCRWRTISC